MGTMRIFSWLIMGALWLSVSSCESEGDSQKAKKNDSDANASIEEIVKEPTIEYGFTLDSFRVEIDTVRENQTLSHVMLPHGINQVQINTADQRSRDSLVGLKFIVPGHRYTALYNPGDTTGAKYIIYEKNKIEYVVFDFTGDVKVSLHEKDVETTVKSASGVITSSLWNAFIDQGLTPDLVMRVVNIYQWSVDFFMIQPGDYYRIIYDERSVDGQLVSAGNIHALEIHSYDSSFYAIPFEVDGQKQYYDGEGGSLRKALLKAPLDYIRISSHFSYNRKHPVLGIVRPHLGVDYAAPSGTPVVTVGDGTVIFSGWSGGAGNLIKVKHNEKITTYYMHLLRRDVKQGDHVTQGQQIGTVGSTGLSTGPHLDYRIQINGKFVNPVSADIPTSEPLEEAHLPTFMTLRDSLVSQLKQIELPEADHSSVELDTLHQPTHEIDH